MNSYKNTGNTLVQYGIIIGLVILALIPVFIIFGGTIVGHFQNLYEGLKSKSSNQTQTLTQNSGNTGNNQEYKAGDLGGTINNPVKKCIDDKCTIDYGDFMLNGVPTNVDDFIRSTGTSGGTETLVALIEQIATQLKEKGDLDGAKEYEELANLCHYLASIEKAIESSANKCMSRANKDNPDCFSRTLSLERSQLSRNIPENIKPLLPDFTANSIQLSGNSNMLTVDYAINQYHTDKESFDKRKEESPIFAIADKFNNIIENPTYTNGMKGVTIELMNHISDLSRDINEKLWLSGNSATSEDCLYSYDLITGEPLKSYSYFYKDLNDLLTPRASTKTNVDSALICAAGWNNDSGSKCH